METVLDREGQSEDAGMKVAAYVQLHRSTNTPSGVGQHLIHMVRGLCGARGIEVSILASRNHLDRRGCVPADNPLKGVPARALPLARRWLERMWQHRRQTTGAAMSIGSICLRRPMSPYGGRAWP
jgi:hypothetical protein